MKPPFEIYLQHHVLQILLARGANASFADALGRTALHLVCARGDPEVFAAILAVRPLLILLSVSLLPRPCVSHRLAALWYIAFRSGYLWLPTTVHS